MFIVTVTVSYWKFSIRPSLSQRSLLNIVVDIDMSVILHYEVDTGGHVPHSPAARHCPSQTEPHHPLATDVGYHKTSYQSPGGLQDHATANISIYQYQPDEDETQQTSSSWWGSHSLPGLELSTLHSSDPDELQPRAVIYI